MTTGTVKWFNPNKGFGFIEPSDGSTDVFLHITALERAGIATIGEGQQLQYELAAGRDGKTSADNVSLLD